MSQHTASVIWKRKNDEAYTNRQYSRAHRWVFDGGLTVPASASPHVVQPPYSAPENIDPEEAYVASISACHMLFFLDIAARQNLIVDEYTDNAIGIMEKDGSGKIAITQVKLRPQVIFSGKQQPTKTEQEKIHHRAHELCFIANSVKTQIITELP